MAALTGHFGVPVFVVHGDRGMAEEAQAFLGQVETVAVKEGVPALERAVCTWTWRRS